MRLSLMLEPQTGLSYGQIRAFAQRSHAAGLDGMYRSDHYHSFGEDGVDSTDAWATLAGLVREVPDLVMGTLVSPATFRTVGNLARVVNTVAQMAGTTADGRSRVHLGLGTGWFEPEHRQHGFPFEDLDTRFRRMEEQLKVIRGLFDPAAQPFSFSGDFVTLADAVFAPALAPAPHLIVGGGGPRRTPTLAATHADELNVVMKPPSAVAERVGVVAEVAESIGRDPVPTTVMGPVVIGETEAEVTTRLEAVAAVMGQPADKLRQDFAASGLVGTVDQARERLAEYADAGAVGMACQHVVADDLDMIDLIAALRA